VEFLRAIVLGIVQGLTEFLPVSSSGHLILVPALFRWPDQGLAFDVALHAGTLIALLGYFWRDWVGMVAGLAGDLRSRCFRWHAVAPGTRMAALIAVGTLPAGVIGLLFNDWFESNVRQPWLVACTLALFGAVMLVVDRRASGTPDAKVLGPADAFLIGCGQALALVPGVSRSGATIVAGLLLGLRREEAARFAFLLGTPAFVGAFVLEARDLPQAEGGVLTPLVGMAVAAATGALAIAWLLRFLRTRSLRPFVYYRWAAAALTLLVGAIRVT
jgi:undecaprenyl-diphosphatase